MENKKFYQKAWFTIIFLIVLWPVGLAVMWSNKVFNKWSRFAITLFFSICVIYNFNTTQSIPHTALYQKATQVAATEKDTEITTLSPAENSTTNTTAVYTTNMENNVNTSENTVYIGKTGTKYHKKSCSSLKGKGTEITLEDALAQGREPCKRCKPK